MQEYKISIRQAIVLVIIAMLSIQFGASFAKSLFPEAGPVGASFLRITFAAMMLIAVFKPWKYKINRNQAHLILGYGLSLGLMNLTFYLSLARIPLGVAVAIEFTGPLLVSVFSSRKLKDFFWVLLAVIGLSLLFPGQERFSTGLDILGASLALVAGLLWALYIIFGSKLHQVPGRVSSSLGMLVAALTILPFGLYAFNTNLMSLKILGSGLTVALLSSAIPYSLEMFAMKVIPAKNFGILMSLEPVIATLSGFLVLHEVLSGHQILAIVFIVIASLGSVYDSKAG